MSAEEKVVKTEKSRVVALDSWAVVAALLAAILVRVEKLLGWW